MFTEDLRCVRRWGYSCELTGLGVWMGGTLWSMCCSPPSAVLTLAAILPGRDRQSHLTGDVSPAPSLTAGGRTGGRPVPPAVPHEAPAPTTQGRGFPVLSDPKASDPKEFGKVILEGTQT